MWVSCQDLRVNSCAGESRTAKGKEIWGYLKVLEPLNHYKHPHRGEPFPGKGEGGDRLRQWGEVTGPVYFGTGRSCYIICWISAKQNVGSSFKCLGGNCRAPIKSGTSFWVGVHEAPWNSTELGTPPPPPWPNLIPFIQKCLIIFYFFIILDLESDPAVLSGYSQQRMGPGGARDGTGASCMQNICSARGASLWPCCLCVSRSNPMYLKSNSPCMYRVLRTSLLPFLISTLPYTVIGSLKIHWIKWPFVLLIHQSSI